MPNPSQAQSQPPRPPAPAYPARPAQTPSAAPALDIHVLPRGATLAIVDGAGLRLRVLEGEVWITEERSLVDLVIGAGESCPLTRTGSALVEVRDRARLVLEPHVPGASARVVRVKTSPTGAWRLLHRRPRLLARIGATLDRVVADAARRLARHVLHPMVGARARRVLQLLD